MAEDDSPNVLQRLKEELEMKSMQSFERMRKDENHGKGKCYP